MASLIDPKKLMPNSSNTVFEPLTPEVYAALKDDIAQNGIQTACMVTPDFTIIAGHHRVKAAIELGLAAVPVEIHDVSPEEAERLLIADNVLRRQITNPMEQARLIRRLKELHGVKRGPKTESHGTSNPVKFTQIAEIVGVGSESAHQLDRLNKLIQPLQDLVSDSTFNQSQALALASLTVKDQQALYDALGAERLSQLKGPDIQQAKKGPDTAALEAKLTALQAERDNLANQVHGAPDPDLLDSLQTQLDAAEEARQDYADELARLKAQGPVERIIEKVVEVEKPVPTADPAQAQRITRLEQQLQEAQSRLDYLARVGDAGRDLQKVEAQRKEAEKSLKTAQEALAAIARSTSEQTGYRAALGQFVQDAAKRARPILSGWQQLAEHPRYSLNWGLYYDVQGLASQLETIAAGLRLMELDPQAAKKHQQTHGQVIETTAIPTDTEPHEEGVIIDVYPVPTD